MLLANSGQNNEQTAQPLHVGRVTVQLWRHPWDESVSKLAVLEKEGIDRKALMEWVEGILTDKQGFGAPVTFSTGQVVQIVALACEDPQASAGSRVRDSLKFEKPRVKDSFVMHPTSFSRQ